VFRGYKILEERVTPDHVHLFIEVDPFDSPVKVFKGVGSLRLQKKFSRAEEEGEVSYGLHHITWERWARCQQRQSRTTSKHRRGIRPPIKIGGLLLSLYIKVFCKRLIGP